MSMEDCYFFIDPTIPQENRKVLCLHIECRDKHYPDIGWFYEGSKEGYGPWDYRCHCCKKLIHKADDDNQN